VQETDKITKCNGTFHIRFAVMTEDGQRVDFEKEFQNVDYIQIKTPNGNHIPLCYKCPNSCLQDFFDVGKGETIRGSELVGCKKLGVEAWKKGWYRDKDDGLIWQHNCPLLKEKGAENS